ncbi:MAG: hypothetical protein MRZ79_26670 [Bacteroidia bacterium]|nr:hypothetical protein [Bacteroidia bacterium]
MGNLQTTLITILFWVVSSTSIFAQGVKPNKFHFELEPIQFINSGWSVVGHYAISKRLQIGSNAFAQIAPESFNNFAFDISGDIDLLAEQEFGINLSVRYFLQEKEVQEGWVISLPLGWETWRLTDEGTEVGADYSFWYLSPRIGYLWYPFKEKNFYLLGEAVAIIPIIMDDAIQFDNSTVAINSLIPIPSIGIGIAF